MSKALFILILATAVSVASAHAQAEIPPRAMQLSLSGPRVGITVLTGEAARIAKDDHGVSSPVVTQFGWQFEQRFLSSENGPTGVFEWVLLAGGLEQGVLFPSITWITGIRTQSGVEFGVGPNLTALGVGLATGAGINLTAGNMSFPLNVAVVSSGSGVRTSVLGGFTLRR